MEKVTKWHCFLADYSYYISHGYSHQRSFKCEVLTVDRSNLNNLSIGLVCLKDTERNHFNINTGYPWRRYHAFWGTKKQALRAMLPKALEAVAGDMAATVKLMKFMEENGLDLEEESYG